jgi:hypothetical protein
VWLYLLTSVSSPRSVALIADLFPVPSPQLLQLLQSCFLIFSS